MTPLRQRMLDALILRGMALRTQESYIDAVARLARHYKRSPDALSAEEVQGYLLYLLRDRQRSRSTVNQYGCAFRFLYGTVLGFEVNRQTGASGHWLLMPQLHRAIGRKVSAQIGAGAERAVSGPFRPRVGLRIIREF